MSRSATAILVCTFLAPASWAARNDSPLQFEPAVGSRGEHAFVVRCAGHWIELTAGGARFHADGTSVDMILLGGNPSAPAVGMNPGGAVVNYLIGPDETRWRANVRGFERVEFRDVYPGVNLV